MVTEPPDVIAVRQLDPEHKAEVEEYQFGRRFLFDPEAWAYATALKWERDDYEEEGGIVIPPPDDPATDCALIPERFRASFERLPEDVRPSVACLYRRALIFNAVCRGRAPRPGTNLRITAAAGFEFDAQASQWKRIGPLSAP
jgi:hypothetical protein